MLSLDSNLFIGSDTINSHGMARFGTPNLNESSPGPSWFVVGELIARHLEREYKSAFILPTQHPPMIW